MKNLSLTILLLSLISILSRCNTIIIKGPEDGVLRKNIDVKKLNELVDRNFAGKDSGEVVFNYDGKKIDVYKYTPKGGYKLKREDETFIEEFNISRKEGIVTGTISSTLINKERPFATDYHYYYPNGMLNFSYAQVNINQSKISKYPAYAYVGRSCVFDVHGNLTSVTDYDKLFPFSLNKVVKLYRQKLKESINAITQIYYDKKRDSLSKKAMNSLFDYRYDYPYYFIASTKVEIGGMTFRVIDGKSGGILKSGPYGIARPHQ